MPFFTVLTCSYNRAKELSRLYQSLQRQTFEDFVWLVMDDSTTDGVEKSIREWQREGHIAIEYHRSEHRGKHWAQKEGFSLVRTPFVVDVDDDDELMDDCLSILHQAWCDIENEGRADIGVVAGLTVDDRGCQICYDGWHGEYCDTDYISMEWTRNHPSENLLSRRSDVIEKANVYRDDGKWLYDKVSLVLESVLWNRVAEKYKTRYVRKVLRIYHREGTERLSLDRFDRQKCINYTFSNYVMLNELQGRYHENVKDTFKYLAEYLSCGIALSVSPQILFHNLQSKWLRVAAILLLPAAYCVGGYFRYRYF